MAHLWTGGPLPARYLQYVACAHLYHCPPDVAGRVDVATALADYACWRAEQSIIEATRRANGG